MNWLCDACGYENEYNDESKTTICRCCQEPAPKSIIIQAQQELDARHREEKRKAHLEKLRRKQELRQRRINYIVKGITHVARALPVTVAAMVIISLVWVGVSFHSEGLTLSGWKTQMSLNINSIPLKGYFDVLEDNWADIDVTERMLGSAEGAVSQIANQMAGHYSAISENITAKGSISDRDNLLGDNVQLILESIGDHLKQVLINTITRREGGADD